MAKQWTVSEVARLARVTVRTLHHYDEIGLLEPSDRSKAGYRLYSRADLERLHQILLYRELGFTLEGIGHVLDEPALDRRTALRAQRELLLEKIRKTEAVVRTVDRTLQTMERNEKMTTDEMFEGFEALADAPEDIREQHARHAEETAERWGDTEAYRTSMRRVKDYSGEDWERIKALGDETEDAMARLMSTGAKPASDEAMDGAEAMRAHITRWFYPCSREMHAGLADMYEADPRFRAHYDERAEGLAEFVAAAIRANSGRSGGREEAAESR